MSKDIFKFKVYWGKTSFKIQKKIKLASYCGRPTCLYTLSPPAVTVCHTFLYPLPPKCRRRLWTPPNGKFRPTKGRHKFATKGGNSAKI